MKETSKDQSKVDTLQERIDKAFMEVGLTPNWVYDKAGKQFVTIRTGIKISSNKQKNLETSIKNKG